METRGLAGSSTHHGVLDAHDRVWPSRAEWEETLGAAYQLAVDYLATLPDAPVSQHASPAEMAARFDAPLPEAGCAPQAALREWIDRAGPGIVRSSGPRYFGFVTGGSLPAAVAGDWFASAIDQNAFSWLSSPAGAQTEITVVRWLLDLFELPASWSGALTTGATMANLCGLAAGREWASHRMGFNAARDGMGGHPPIAVISSAEVHQSAIKACGILGLGREAISKVPSHGGAIDLDAFRRALSQVTGPAIVIANAAEVNTGTFDPIRSIAAACAAHPGGAWLHVDAAFGLYAALVPELRPLLDGIELADSVATDGHKWLNVPYDCGIVFVRDGGDLRNAFSATASYLSLSDAPTVWNAMDYVPEFSRRLRALSVWCALRSTGRDGMRKIVERAIANTRQFAAWIAQQPELELMAPAHLNIACFRVRGDASPEREDDLTARVVEEMQRGGIAYVTATRWNGRVAIRAAFDNWTTSAEDVNSLQRAVMLAVTRAATNQ